MVKLEIDDFLVFHFFLKNGFNVIALKVRLNQPNILTILSFLHDTKALVINKCEISACGVAHLNYALISLGLCPIPKRASVEEVCN